TTVWEIITEIAPAGIAALLPEWLVNLWDKIKNSTPEDLLNEMIEAMGDALSDMFPSARGIVDELVDMATGIVDTVGGVIRNIISGNFGLSDFLDICKELGGAIAGMVLGMLADAALDAAADAANAVGDFICDPPW
ncbi:MAG: phage-related protein, partial [Myxococcota bacterium]